VSTFYRIGACKR
jgi:transposase